MKVSRFLFIAAVAGAILAGCKKDKDVDLTGNLTIDPTVDVTTGTELTAKYNGTETVSFQWNKNKTVIGSATGSKYTPSEEGSYTVTASAKGYNSKTSAPVEVKRHTHTWVWVETSALAEIHTCTSCGETGETRSAIQSRMTAIPAGSVAMNANFTVNLSSFKMCKYQVTQAQYEAVMGNNPSHFHGGSGREVAEGEVQGKRPVENITWFDAIEFCNKLSLLEGFTLVYTITGRTPENGYPITNATVTADFSKNGYRIPTEAQWEYACRAGTTTTWVHGSIEAGLENYAWYSVNSNNKTHETGKKTANAFGLYDMHGNVWEWCWDFFGGFPNGTETDYRGPVSGSAHIDRGGSWNETATRTGSSYRDARNFNISDNSLGFRLVCP